MVTFPSSHLPVSCIPAGSVFSRWVWPFIDRASFSAPLHERVLSKSHLQKQGSSPGAGKAGFPWRERAVKMMCLPLEVTLCSWVSVSSVEGFVAL